jgi:hypothetical protein
MYHVGNQPQSHDDLDIIAAWEKTGNHFPRKAPMKCHEYEEGYLGNSSWLFNC